MTHDSTLLFRIVWTASGMIPKIIFVIEFTKKSQKKYLLSVAFIVKSTAGFNRRAEGINNRDKDEKSFHYNRSFRFHLNSLTMFQNEANARTDGSHILT